MVQRMKETTMPRIEGIYLSSHIAFDHLYGKYIPVTDIRKSGRRPTLSNKKAALIETIKLRRALPIES
jgi:hypothetical protein